MARSLLTGTPPATHRALKPRSALGSCAKCVLSVFLLDLYNLARQVFSPKSWGRTFEALPYLVLGNMARKSPRGTQPQV